MSSKNTHLWQNTPEISMCNTTTTMNSNKINNNNNNNADRYFQQTTNLQEPEANRGDWSEDKQKLENGRP